jgi:hypothetical protein
MFGKCDVCAVEEPKENFVSEDKLDKGILFLGSDAVIV